MLQKNPALLFEEGARGALRKNARVHARELGSALLRWDQEELRGHAVAIAAFLILLVHIVAALTADVLFSHSGLSSRPSSHGGEGL